MAVRPVKKPPAEDLARIARDVVACERCPRLRRYCREIAATKRRAYRQWDYWGKPVPGFGDPGARLWVVGLAPAAHGGNRTGRVFTGDSSGDWLYRALHTAGFARLATSVARDDGQELLGAYVSAAARCAPPDNKPLPEEIARCAPYLEREWMALRQVRVLLPLGRIAFDAVLRLLAAQGYAIPKPRPPFAHAAQYEIRPGPGAAIRANAGSAAPTRGPITLLASYHPSRQNTQTGRLTLAMFDAVFQRARALVQNQRPSSTLSS